MNLLSSRDGILAIKETFHTNFSFHDGILAIKESFTRTSIFHDGILAIKEPFTRNFSFSRWNLSRSFSHETFLFHDGILAVKEPFTRTFSFFTMEFSECTILGEDSFHIYIYIYHKEYLHRIRLVKNLAS
jgi:hypothetical protein